MYIDRKWNIIEPTMHTGPGIDSSNFPWTNNSFINLNRVLKGKRYHILSPHLYNDRADAYYLVSLINTNIEKEIEFIDYAHSQGSKVVLAISIDGRFMSGHGLSDPVTGRTHTELCNRVDAIASGVSDNLHIYGRNQHKVFSIGDFVERLNFSTKPYNERTIDLLATGTADETSLTFNIILFEMLKEKYPEKRFVYAFRKQPVYNDTMEFMKNKYPHLEFTMEHFHNLLKNSKGYLNIEQRPRAGRAVLEAWYHRVPSMSFNSTYFSRLYPDFSFDNMSFDKMVEAFERMSTCNYEDCIKKTENLIEQDYAENTYQRMIQILDRR